MTICTYVRHYKANLAYLLNGSGSPLYVVARSIRANHHGRIRDFRAVPNWGLLEVSFPRDWSHRALWALERHITRSYFDTEVWLELWHTKSRSWECLNSIPYSAWFHICVHRALIQPHFFVFEYEFLVLALGSTKFLGLWVGFIDSSQASGKHGSPQFQIHFLKWHNVYKFSCLILVGLSHFSP